MAAAVHSRVQDQTANLCSVEDLALKLQAKLQKLLVLIGISAMFFFAIGFVAPESAHAQESTRKVKSKVSPTYPELAKHANISGTVKLEATIAPNGSVKSVKVLGGHPLLAGAAEDAMKRWKYEAGAGETTAVVEFHFNPEM